MRTLPVVPKSIAPARHLADVHYDIRGPLSKRAGELEKQGRRIIKLNIGNPSAFGFHAPAHLREAIEEHLGESDGYTHQRGILPAREAVAADARRRGFTKVTADDVFMGNGVSELILMTMEALLDPGDEVLVPAPDYPLWTAAVTLTGARAVHYPCRPANGCVPDPAEVEKLVTPRTRALVLINPNNPTGAVYPPQVVEALVRIAERRGLVVFSDEIYDRILYDGATHTPTATFCHETLCATFGGLSKNHRACGYRAGWVCFTGDKSGAGPYLDALELLSSLRLCPNAPAQWAVKPALEDEQTVDALITPGGRLYQQRAAVLRGVENSKYLKLVAPRGALYAFVGVKTDKVPGFDDARFAMTMLEKESVLLVPGSGFNVDYRDHFRITLLPPADVIDEVFMRMERVLGG